MAYRPKSIVASWRTQSPATRLLRAWLGITWIYGGWDKASDPGFLNPGGATYIGAQIQAFAEISPIGDLLLKSYDQAVLLGWLTILGEFAVGIATLLFIAPRFAALLGFSISFGLWLTATFNVRPYFYGSDTAYAVMWLAYFLILHSGNKGARLDMNRRGVLRIASVVGLSGGFIGLGNLFPRKVLPIATAANKRIVALAKVPVGGTFKFTSASGNPALLFRTKAGVFAYDLTCTHQGCTVEYAPSLKQLRCACHGAAFDPMSSAKVIAGPAPRPLAKIKVKISGKNIVEV
ncbi:MAG: hypothetical protein RL193_689 [Actinomycetota bacterium]